MAFLQGSGAISLGDIQTTMGGASPASINEYYRGGAYVPSSKTATIYDPTSGSYSSAGYRWVRHGLSGVNQGYWAGVYTWLSGYGDITSYAHGGYIYYRGPFLYLETDPYGGTDYYNFAISRSYSGTVSINTGVPSSGQISLSQFYGAEKP